MKYLRFFKTTADYEAAKSSLATPNVSFDEQKGIIIYKQGDSPEPVGGPVVVRYNFATRYEECYPLGDGNLYDLIDSMTVDGQPFDIDDLIVYGVQGSGSASGSGSGSAAGVVGLPLSYAGAHTVEFEVGSKLFKEAYIKDAEYASVDIPFENSVACHANGHEYVDLGLPSGTLWATCNLGADTPEGYGKYFQWADLQGYTKEEIEGGAKNFGWPAPYAQNYDNLQKYTGQDGLAELELSDDAAHNSMGGSWRMPSEKQIRELIKYTNNEWTTENGVNGYKFTSKADSSKSIFIPASGYADGGSINGIESYGCLWSRSVRSQYPDSAYYLAFNSGSVYRSDSGRCFGYSVRGIL